VNFIRQEPALVTGVLVAVLVLGAAYFLTAAQMIAAGALLPIVAAVFVRSQVYSPPTVAKLLSGDNPPPPK
jgi:hypothetical protein